MIESIIKDWSGLARLSRGSTCAIMAALVLLFCPSIAAPAMAQPAACQGLEPSPRMCAQPSAAGALDPLVGLTEHARPAQWVPVQTGVVSRCSDDRLVAQFDLVPSTPRAPPLSLS